MRFAGRRRSNAYGQDSSLVVLEQCCKGSRYVSLGNNFGALEKRKPRYDQMAADWITNEAEDKERCYVLNLRSAGYASCS